MFRTVFMLCGLVLMGTTARGESPALPSSALLAPYEKIPKNKTELIETLLGEMREGGEFLFKDYFGPDRKQTADFLTQALSRGIDPAQLAKDFETLDSNPRSMMAFLERLQRNSSRIPYLSESLKDAQQTLEKTPKFRPTFYRCAAAAAFALNARDMLFSVRNVAVPPGDEVADDEFAHRATLISLAGIAFAGAYCSADFLLGKKVFAEVVTEQKRRKRNAEVLKKVETLVQDLDKQRLPGKRGYYFTRASEDKVEVLKALLTQAGPPQTPHQSFFRGPIWQSILKEEAELNVLKKATENLTPLEVQDLMKHLITSGIKSAKKFPVDEKAAEAQLEMMKSLKSWLDANGKQVPLSNVIETTFRLENESRDRRAATLNPDFMTKACLTSLALSVFIGDYVMSLGTEPMAMDWPGEDEYLRKYQHEIFAATAIALVSPCMAKVIGFRRFLSDQLDTVEEIEANKPYSGLRENEWSMIRKSLALLGDQNIKGNPLTPEQARAKSAREIIGLLTSAESHFSGALFPEAPGVVERCARSLAKIIVGRRSATAGRTPQGGISQ